MKKILILNGPNLNMLGLREPEIYGTQTLDDVKIMCEEAALPHAMDVDFRQSNHEGQLIDWIQESRMQSDALIFNAAGYSHTSVAIHDALKLLEFPIIEVHISEPTKREDFRHFSYITPVATDVISGHGTQGYVMALEKIAEIFL